MEPSTENRLAELNRSFYHSFAKSFADTRKRIQPGVRILLSRLPKEAHLLDLGCGPAASAAWLSAHEFSGEYTGADFSADLLSAAHARTYSFTSRFFELDLLEGDWPLVFAANTFTHAALFAVLHHIPGFANRLAVLRKVRGLLAPGGVCFVSTWQIRRSPRLVQRIVPWSTIGISEQELEPGDVLIDWRRDGQGLRYIHLVDDIERGNLLASAGFTELEFFQSDGDGGNLSDYSISIIAA